MSLQLTDLSVLAYANNFTLWHYKTVDASIATTGYFNNAADMMNVNDMIVVNIDTDGTPATAFYVITAISGGAVTVTALS